MKILGSARMAGNANFGERTLEEKLKTLQGTASELRELHAAEEEKPNGSLERTKLKLEITLVLAKLVEVLMDILKDLPLPGFNLESLSKLPSRELASRIQDYVPALLAG